MTEKRFTSDIHRIYDNNEEIACADTMGDAEILVDKLNEQEELIKRLKTIREEQTETILKQKRKIRELEKENQNLKQMMENFVNKDAYWEKKAKQEIEQLKIQNQRQYNRLKELTELMYERQWEKLENIVDKWEKADELLEQEWGTIL